MVKLDQSKVFYRLNDFMAMVYSACGMPVWCFNLSGKLFYTSCPNEDQFRMILEMGGCLAYALSDDNKQDPVILADPMGLMYAADYVRTGEQASILILLGPFFSTETAMENVKNALRKMELSVKAGHRVIQTLQQIPVITMEMAEQYVSMLHFCISGVPNNRTHIRYQQEEKNREQHLKEKLEEDMETPEQPDMDPDSMQLERLGMKHVLQAIRTGNKNCFQSMQSDGTGFTMNDEPALGSKDYLRDQKNMSIVYITQCSLAAVEGGISEQASQRLRQFYIRKIEEQKNIIEIMHLMEDMVREFAGMVYDCKQSGRMLSIPVQNACEFIRRNLTKDFKLTDIAKEVGYTEYYLTRKFRKETGISITDYINNEKIELAKIWLISTNKDIQEIVAEVNFGSRNYFSRVFHKITGMTPGEYRKRSQGKQE